MDGFGKSSVGSVGDGEIESEHCAYMYLVHSLTTLIVSILRSLSPSSSDSLTTLLFQSPKRSLDPSRLIGSLLKTANGLFFRIYSNYRALYCLLATVLNTLKMWDVKSLTLRSDSVAIMTTFLRDEASVTSPIGTCNMTPGYCENFLSNSEHCEPKKMLSCVSDKVLCDPLTTVLFTVLKYDVITTRYKWNLMPDYGEIFVNSVLGKAKNLRLIFLSAKRLLASRSSWDAEFVPVPSLISEVEWYAMPLVYSTVFSQKVILKQANLDTLHNHMVYFTVFSHTCNHKFLFLFSKVCPNESLPLGSCGPRRCIIGLSIPAYPSGTCIAVVGLYPTQFGNEGRLGTSCSECSADGT